MSFIAEGATPLEAFIELLESSKDYTDYVQLDCTDGRFKPPGATVAIEIATILSTQKWFFDENGLLITIWSEE